jgi:CRISPR-associated protein Csx17
MSIHLHTLKGCSPAPLANYLKALCILRLVGKQADKQARGWWNGEHFCLMTKLSQEELETFFLERYEPTPLLSPWNKGCGFFKANDPNLIPLEKSHASRFEPFRQGVVASRSLLNAITNADAVIRSIKARTKTNKSFQTEEQRKLLEKCEALRDSIAQLQSEADKPGISDEKKRELADSQSVIRSLVTKRDTYPQKVEVHKLKGSDGYKRLLALADRRFKALKATLIPDCRRVWRGPHAEWMSAAVVLDESGNPEWPSLLGTGGNDGNLDFTNNFMQQLVSLFDVASEQGNPRPHASLLLQHSLWEEPANTLVSSAIGQYQPGSAGGANSSTGFDGGNLVNPWDFILMMEGTIIFTSLATRRLDPAAVTRASAPFAARSHAAGFATPGSEKAQRGEQWMPIWSQPATLRDVSAMFGEGRVQLGRQTAYRPVDVARAISRLGVARGIDAFMRYGYLERNGQSTLAIPLGRVEVRHHPRAYLIDDLAGWMNQLDRRSRDKTAPARLGHAEKRLANTVFAALTHDHTPDRWQAILLAAADVEAIQATGTAIEAQPMPSLRPEWVIAVADGVVDVHEAAEIRLALSLGSAAANYQRNGRPIDPVRHHWLPLEDGARRFKTSDKRLVNDPRVVASGRDAIRDLASVVERRMIEAGMKGQRRSRLVAASNCGARLDDLTQFLSGQLDVEKIAGLARAFMAIRWDKWGRQHLSQHPPRSKQDAQPDEAWLAIRLACLPFALGKEQDIPADERIIRLLNSNNAARAIEIASRRIRAAGIRPPFQFGTVDAATARLWAAALAFPIDWATAKRITETLDPRLKPTKGLKHA